MLALTLERSLFGVLGLGDVSSKVKCSTSTTKLMGFKIYANSDGGGAAAGAGAAGDNEFPWFLPKEVHKIKDPLARALARRIQRLPVQVGSPQSCIMSSCVKPDGQNDTNPVVLLHCFDSSCLEWKCTYPLLEEAGVETWAIDILGWGFSDLERLPPCNATSKRHHLYQLWKLHIKRPMILVGPSLGAAVAIDFAVNFPEAVDKLVLINACVYHGGTGFWRKLPRLMAYGMVSLLKSIPLRLYAKSVVFDGVSFLTILDWTRVSRLHCLLPWWEDATVDYMLSGGYNVTDQINQVRQTVLILWGERDNILDIEVAERLQEELANATLHQIHGCGHLPHVEKPGSVAKLIIEFAQEDGS